MSPPPWESFGFPDILNFGAQGARLGLERAGQTLGANEAADRLGLSYAQLAAENARHAASIGAEAERSAAANALAREGMGLHESQANALNQYRAGEVASRDFRDALAFKDLQRKLQPKPEPVIRTYTLPDGRQIPYIVSPGTGVGSFMHPGDLYPQSGSGNSGLTARQIATETLRNLRKEQSDLSKKWNDPVMGAAMTRKALADPNGPSGKQYTSDQARLKAIKGEIDKILTPAQPASGAGGIGADTLTPPDLSMPDDTGMDDPLGILGGNTNSVGVPP